MIALIIAVVVAYAMVGLLINGFVDIRITTDTLGFIGVVLLWPFIIGVLAISVVAKAPFNLGRKLGARYSKPIGEFFDKLFND
jgi:hypothetical protein